MENLIMAQAPLSDDVLLDTLRVYEENNRNCYGAARLLGIPPQTFQNRLYRAKERFPQSKEERPQSGRWAYPRMVSKEAPNTKWIIGSDFHIWDGEPTLIYKAFVKLAKSLKVDGIILNGDVIDGARVSRHPPVRGFKAPKIEKEIETAKTWLRMLPTVKHKLWTMGNHDIRIDNYIAANANELDGYIMSLQDHFRDWEISWAFEINSNTEVRHRFRSGIHSGYSSSMAAGISTVTGHTHQLQVTAIRDRRGSRWGVETGTMADPFGPQFEYTEGAPNRAQCGFVVLSYDEDGNLMPPEICEVVYGRPVFRGQYVL